MVAQSVRRKKLIEVALPLDTINLASAREKSIRHGHPSTLHLWWSRKPLATARAVIFAQMVDDPASLPDLFPTEQEQDQERRRLFEIIDELVKWDNTTNEAVLQSVRDEIQKSWRRTCAENADHPRKKALYDPEHVPAFHDPFAGGGALPLEAQRLGLEAHASDLNPVAVLINKAMIEIPPKFARQNPVNPEARSRCTLIDGGKTEVHGLAADLRYYGRWIREQAKQRIGHLYPQVVISDEMVRSRPDLQAYAGRDLTVIAWLWARTVKSPNPAFTDVEVPLVSTFMLSTKKGREAYVEPVVESSGYRLRVNVGAPPDTSSAKTGTSAGKRHAFQCVMSGVPITYDYVRREGQAGRIGARLVAIVAKGDRRRVYLSPLEEHDIAGRNVGPHWGPEVRLEGKTRANVSNYGVETFGDLFTPRQLVALDTFCDLVCEARHRVLQDALDAGVDDDGIPLHKGGSAATAYADAICVYLSFAISKLADRGSSICTWFTERDSTRNTFSRQSIPMTWDYAELTHFSTAPVVSWVRLNGRRKVPIAWRSAVVVHKGGHTSPTRVIRR